MIGARSAVQGRSGSGGSVTGTGVVSIRAVGGGIVREVSLEPTSDLRNPCQRHPDLGGMLTAPPPGRGGSP